MMPNGRIKLKVCGMRDNKNIRDVAALHPDYMGFIFYAGSKREVREEFEVPKDLPKSVRRVGVFVNAGLTAMLGLVEKHALDFVQLHGDEPVELCEQIKNNGTGVIKVFSMRDHFDFEILFPFKKSVDYFLFDTMGSARGGTGTTFDWRILEKYDQEIPFFLSGGLSPNNIQNVVKLKGMNIHAVDVNSGVEIAPGMKDVQLIEKVQMSLLNNHWLEY